jgi:hypothetical protein
MKVASIISATGPQRHGRGVSILLLRFITRQQCQCGFSEHHYVDSPISAIYFDNEALIYYFDIREPAHRDAIRRETFILLSVIRVMRWLGLVAIYQRPNTSKPAAAHKIYPYLLGGIAIERVNQV